MNRERILYGLALVVVLGACFAVYQFYFKAKLEKYATDKRLLENLAQSYADLNGTFKDEDPEVVISQYRSVVESWRDAIDVRVPYFNDSDWREHENPPEGVFILQYWYGEQTREMTLALWEKAQAKYGAQVYQRFPQDFQTMLGVPYAEQYQGYDLKEEHVVNQLERLSYGISALELLMEHDAEMIRQVSMYEPRPSGFIGREVEYVRLGLSFVMEMENLIEFVEEMRAADRYFSIEGIKVAHPYIGVRYEPRLEVELYLRRAKPSENFLAGADAPASTEQADSVEQAYTGTFNQARGGGIRRGGDEDEARAAVEEPGVFGRAWQWFKRTVLVTN